MITQKTDALDFTINTRGGDVEQAPGLPGKNWVPTNRSSCWKPPRSLSYQGASGLITATARITWRTARVRTNVGKEAFVLADGQNELQVPMTYTDAAGNTFTKTFVLSVAIMRLANHSVQNTAKNRRKPPLGQLKQLVNLPPHRDTGSSNFCAAYVPRGAAAPHAGREV
ncbi:YidC/Oxa1 family insertase periplasmic-domain containing protein [Salmonella enterica subsp. enterica]|nr:YidC/Oxa1 family insertase periplasmic-domain containing protein [Salmonella enterica subsp. enterica]